MPDRLLVLLAPDWPAAAAAREMDVDAHLPVAVFSGNRVVAANAPARRSGVRLGQLRRHAQHRAPGLIACRHDPSRDERVFAPLVAALEERTPEFSALHPGLLAVPLRAAAAFWGSEERAAEELLSAVTDRTGQELTAGIADTLFTALVAARAGSRVAPGQDAAFLAPRPVQELQCPELPRWGAREELVDVLTHLGLRRLGEFAALPPGHVTGRFGQEGRHAHRQARGEPDPQWNPHRHETELAADIRLDHAVMRADQLGFAGRAVATELLDAVAATGLRCSQVRVTAVSETGRRHTAIWRLEPGAGANDIADRLRWHVESWISGAARAQARTARPRRTGPDHFPEDAGPDGIVRILLEAVEMIEPLEDQPTLL